MMKVMEPTCDTKMTLMLFKNALAYESASPDSLSVEGLTDLVINFQIGGFGKMPLREWLFKNAKKTDNKKKAHAK